MQENTEDNPFRQYAFALYGRQGVAEKLLHLQDQYGLNINMLLLMAWLGRCRQRVDSAFIDDCLVRIGALDTKLIQPLREVRRNIYRLLGNNKHYHHAKALELALETVILDELYQQAITTPPGSIGEFCMADNVHDYCRSQTDMHEKALLQALDFYQQDSFV